MGGGTPLSEIKEIDTKTLKEVKEQKPISLLELSQKAVTTDSIKLNGWTIELVV